VAKQQTIYICQQCGNQQPKWGGKCDACGGWNTLVEEQVSQSIPKGLKHTGKSPSLEFSDLEGQSATFPRYKSNLNEFDRVCGGGLVPGSVILVGGDPGIGKSTLLLQVAAALAHQGKCAYISGEEGVDQIRMRASRLGIHKAPVHLAADNSLRTIIQSMEGHDAPTFVVIDSIQTMYIDNLESAPGTVAQVRTCAQELIRVAKKRNLILILVGHVTKEGTLAGPRVLEHMVDTVLYFEGDRGHQFRILRSVKNRFGPTDEIGIFEMTEQGLQEVPNPSAIFIGTRQQVVSGSCIFAGVEGTRPVLVEIQALVAPSSFGTPRRNVIGWDANRLAMVIAVLEARCGISFMGKDVYLNVAGGLRVTEPAADLAVAAALVSSLHDIGLPLDLIVFGEIGLSGEIRPVGQTTHRLKEAEKLGFHQAIIPTLTKAPEYDKKEINVHTIGHITQLIKYVTQARG
jgi:DNA repair protein RadA/Sms